MFGHGVFRAPCGQHAHRRGKRAVGAPAEDYEPERSGLGTREGRRPEALSAEPKEPRPERRRNAASVVLVCSDATDGRVAAEGISFVRRVGGEVVVAQSPRSICAVCVKSALA